LPASTCLNTDAFNLSYHVLKIGISLLTRANKALFPSSESKIFKSSLHDKLALNITLKNAS